jgi:hypothetical protein
MNETFLHEPLSYYTLKREAKVRRKGNVLEPCLRI